MKKIWLLLCVSLLFTWGCATTKTPPPPVRWDFEKDAITLSLKADMNLNYRKGKAHTMVVCVYQLSEPNSFTQLSGSRDGIYQLLECRPFDESVATVKQYIVNPGQEINSTVNRVDGARFVAVVAGYYSMDKDKIIRLYEIPVEKKRRRTGWLKLWREKYYAPGEMNIVLVLGAQELIDPESVFMNF